MVDHRGTPPQSPASRRCLWRARTSRSARGVDTDSHRPCEDGDREENDDNDDTRARAYHVDAAVVVVAY